MKTAPELTPEVTQTNSVTEVLTALDEQKVTTVNLVKSKFPALSQAYPAQVKVIGIDTKDGPEHPLWDPRNNLPLDEMMVRSIMTHGVIKPIICQKVGTDSVVVDGRRRVLHAREAARRAAAAGEETLKIPVIWSKGADELQMARKEIANRYGVTDGPLTSAKNCQRMIDRGISLEDVATAFGVSGQTITNWLSLLGLDEDVRKAMEKDELSTTAAQMFAPLTKAQQKELLAEVKTPAGKKKTTVATVAKKVKARQGKEPTGVTPKDRVEKAVTILTKASGGDATKEAYLEALNKLSRALANKSFDKLGED